MAKTLPTFAIVSRVLHPEAPFERETNPSIS